MRCLFVCVCVRVMCVLCCVCCVCVCCVLCVCVGRAGRAYGCAERKQEPHFGCGGQEPPLGCGEQEMQHVRIAEY